MVSTIAMGLGLLLRLPQLPYNVKELFRNDGSVLDLVLFALALLWTGAGAAWLAACSVGRCLKFAGRRLRWQPPWSA